MLLEVDSNSYWAQFTTHFPVLGSYLETRHRTACVLGASDGKFVIPLLKAGLHVTAVDIDEIFLFGGTVPCIGGDITTSGLVTRLDEEDLKDQCTVMPCDYMEWNTSEVFDVVVTSGSWSMPENRSYSLRKLVGRAQDLTAPNGLLFADYLTELPTADQTGEHYPMISTVCELFPADGWEILDSVDLGVHGESHYDKPQWHQHRFAALIAHKRGADFTHFKQEKSHTLGLKSQRRRATL